MIKFINQEPFSVSLRIIFLERHRHGLSWEKATSHVPFIGDGRRTQEGTIPSFKMKEEEE